jgi:hypothetical protein
MGRVIDSNKLALLNPTKKCDEGEQIYLSAEENIDIANAVKDGIFESGFQHWDLHGKHEGDIGQGSTYLKYAVKYLN